MRNASNIKDNLHDNKESREPLVMRVSVRNTKEKELSSIK